MNLWDIWLDYRCIRHAFLYHDVLNLLRKRRNRGYTRGLLVQHQSCSPIQWKIRFTNFSDSNSAATLSSLKTSLTNMASTYGKELIVAELDWPTQCSSPAYQFPSDLKSIPFSAEGQTTFVQQVASVVASVSKGAGLFYWEPAWMNNQGLGSSCESNTMFAWPGTALSSLSVFSTI